MTNKIKMVKTKEGEKTTREKYEECLFKSDRLRKKYDLRNIDPKTINNIFMRSHIIKLKEQSEEEKKK